VGVELQLIELGQSIDEFGHGGAEVRDQIGLGDAAILQRVMQERRHERLGVELPVGAQARDGNGMRDVGLAAVAQLAQVRMIGVAIGLAHPFDGCIIEVMQLFEQGIEAGGHGIGGCLVGVKGYSRVLRRGRTVRAVR